MSAKFSLTLNSYFTGPEILRFENQFRKIALSEISRNLKSYIITSDSLEIISSIYIEHYKEIILNILWLITEGELSYLKQFSRKLCIDAMEFLTEPNRITKILEECIKNFSIDSNNPDRLKLSKIDWKKFNRSESLFLYRETFNLIISKDQHFKSIINSLTAIAIQQANKQDLNKEVA